MHEMALTFWTQLPACTTFSSITSALRHVQSCSSGSGADLRSLPELNLGHLHSSLRSLWNLCRYLRSLRRNWNLRSLLPWNVLRGSFNLQLS